MQETTIELSKRYSESAFHEALPLLEAIGRIPAPSHHEEKRVAFIKSWLEAQGAKDVAVDEAQNVIVPIGVEGADDLYVVMAHTDLVFPDMTELPLRIADNRIYAPGIGDDTANLVCLLMGIKYIVKHQLAPKHGGVLLVANSCEEGLGNLKGCRAIFDRYGDRVREFISLDGKVGRCCDLAVGSHRYRVSVKTEGGHSYAKFGNANAIEKLAGLVLALYKKKVPDKAKTTYNVGMIEGGTSVNSIAESASMLYEFRSEDRECLSEMEAFFNATLDEFRAKGIDVTAEVLGIRPCSGDVDTAALSALTERAKAVMQPYCDAEVVTGASSTDANIPLSLGIPGVTYGVIRGEGSHTRGEWVEIDSIRPGIEMALQTVLHYFDA